MPNPTRPHPSPPSRNRFRSPALAAALATVAFAACKSDHGSADKSEADSGAELKTGEGYAAGDRAAYAVEPSVVDQMGPSGIALMPVRDQRKVVRTGQVDLVIKTYDDTRARLDALVAAAGGYIDSTQVAHSEGLVSRAVLVLRVPSGAFGDLLPKLRELGEIQSENTDASDITAEYVDLSARLGSARALEARLIELAANRTGTVSDVLEVERELNRVRSEIEQYEGRMRMWDDQVSLSTLTITMSTVAPEIAAPADPSFTAKIERAFDSSVDSLGNAGESLAMAGVSLLPWLPLILPGLLLGRRLIRKHLTLPRAIVHISAPPPPPYYPPPPPPPTDLDPAA